MTTTTPTNFVLETHHYGAISMNSLTSWSVEASCLGWKPGQPWPKHITTKGGGSLERTFLSCDLARYSNFNGSVVLTVFND